MDKNQKDFISLEFKDYTNEDEPHKVEILEDSSENQYIKTNYSIESSQLQEDSEAQKSFKRHLGNNCCFRFVDGEPKYTIGPHWPLFLCAFSFLAGISILVMVHILPTADWKTQLVTTFICLNELLSYINVALKNPGITSSSHFIKNEEAFESLKQYCKICKIVRTKDIYHCSDCNICIQGYDHHCPWTGKCIGKGNINEFFFFLCSTGVFMVYNILIAVAVN